MGTSSWSNDQPRDLIVPSGAGPNDTRIVIGPDIPAVLHAYYLEAKAWIGEYVDANHYHYEIWMTNGPSYFWATGWVDLTDVGDEVHELEFTQLFGPSFIQRVTVGLIDPVLIDYWNVVANFGRSTGTLAQASDLQWAGVSLPRGVVDGVNVTTAGALAAAASAETDIPAMKLTANGLKAGRTYLIYGVVNLSLTVNTDIWELRLRKTSAVIGTELGESDGTGGGTAMMQVIYQPAADENATLFFSFLRRTGTGTVQPFGSPGGGVVRTLAVIYDISANTQWRTA